MIDPYKYYYSILHTYICPMFIPLIYKHWTESNRHYHGEFHLNGLLKLIEDIKNELSIKNYKALILAAFFHDIYYLPNYNENEEKSISIFIEQYSSRDIHLRNKVIDLILCTKYRKIPQDSLEKIFWEFDNDYLINGDLEYFKKVEIEIRKEYPSYSDENYKIGRLKFLESNRGILNSNFDKLLDEYINYINTFYK